jgi:hypothetical protein
MPTLTKKMSTLTKGMGHEKDMVFLAGIFTKVAILTKFEIVHLVKRDNFF